MGHNIKQDDWDAINQKVKKSHPNSARLNNLLLKKKSEANDKLLELETKKEDVSSKVIKKQIKPTGGASFFDQAKIFTDNLKNNGKFNRYTTEIGRVEKFRDFLKGNDISFPEITVNLLNQLGHGLSIHGIFQSALSSTICCLSARSTTRLKKAMSLTRRTIRLAKTRLPSNFLTV